MDDINRLKEIRDMIRRQADGKFRVVRVHNNLNRPEVLGKGLTSREADAFMKMLGDSE